MFKQMKARFGEPEAISADNDAGATVSPQTGAELEPIRSLLTNDRLDSLSVEDFRFAGAEAALVGP